MFQRIAPLVVAASLLTAPVAAADAKVETEQDKTLYAIGLVLSQRLGAFALTESELAVVKAGLTDGVLGRPKQVEIETYGPKINELQKQRAMKLNDTQEAAGKAYIDKILAANKDLKKTGSGLVMQTVKEGTGPSPTVNDRIKVHYTGTLIDGTVFDSSVKKGQPAEFALTKVIDCWQEAFQFLKPGGKAKIYCPASIAYRSEGRPGIPPGATLTFEIELLEILK